MKTCVISGARFQGRLTANGERFDRNALTAAVMFYSAVDALRPTFRPEASIQGVIPEGGVAPNVVPDRCEVDVDRRLIPGETSPEEILVPFERLAAAISRDHPEVELSFRIREWTDAAEARPDTEIAELCRTAVAEERGVVPNDTGITGITDARFYINEARIPTAILGPGSLTIAHTANEWVAVDELVAAARIYARVFVRFLGVG